MLVRYSRHSFKRPANDRTVSDSPLWLSINHRFQRSREPEVGLSHTAITHVFVSHLRNSGPRPLTEYTYFTQAVQQNTTLTIAFTR